MNASRLLLTPALILAGLNPCHAAGDAVELHVDEDLQQVRVEARDADTGRWLAIASGYRDHSDSGWLKVAVPEAYAGAELRVLGSTQESPLKRHMESARSANPNFVDYPPSLYRGGPESVVDANGGGGEPVIEEADIWAWNGDILYFYNQYRGLQVVDLADPSQPEWLDYYRYPARGEDLYSIEDGTIILIGTGTYWLGEAVALQMLSFDGSQLTHEETVELEAGQYMDSRRYGDYLYVMTREWRYEITPRGEESRSPRIHLYTISLLDDLADRVVDKKTFTGNGWLDAVLTAQPGGILLSLNKWENRMVEDFRYRWHSEVHVLEPGEDGIPELVGIAPLAGILHDKFKMNYKDGRLTTISQQADWTTGRFSRATKLENFALGDSGFVKTGSLDLAPGETLFATRFYGDTVYVVTFLFVDPLFSIDNSDPSNPVVAGELEVPGWSTYIEWVDDRLFAIGLEDSQLTVSIFDVADPANMSLKDRVYLSEDSWAWSEALYDDQAISFFPEAGLLMLPFTTWSWKSSEQVQAMQLVSWDDTGLQLRGAIAHLDTPRRGTLKGDTVITISGREVVTTDVSDPDLPVEGGKATMAWNASRLIELEDHLVQLETPDLYFGWYRYGPYDPSILHTPVAYITSKDEPNVPAAEAGLAPGRILGAALQDDKLVLLQDISENPNGDYWEIPEKQDLAVRLYDLANPLEPALLSEVSLNSPDYLGAGFDPHIRGNHIVWSSKSANHNFFIDALYVDIWPGPYYMQKDLSYIVTEYNPATEAVSIAASDLYQSGGSWSNASVWYWEDPVLLASLTEYIQLETPEEERKDYEARTRLVAVDFSIPGEPLELAGPPVPQNLLGVEPGEADAFHFLYFEPEFNLLEVWGWDGAIAVKLFDQQIKPADESSYTYSLAWMPPFHLRNRWNYTENTSSSYLEVWLHDTEQDRFDRIDSIAFENDWLGAHAVKEPYYLQATNNALYFFRGDAAGGSFDLLQSVEPELPNYYGMRLEETIIDPDRAWIPVGLYGVETLTFDEPLEEAASMAFARLEADASWTILDSSRWQRVERSSTAGAGAIDSFYWLYKADSMDEVDPAATDLGDFVRESEWFGTYGHKATDPSWIRHREHGELFIHMDTPQTTGGFHMFYHRFGFVWTRDDVYPWLYCYRDDEWIHYLPDSGLDGSRWYYGMKSGWFRGN